MVLIGYILLSILVTNRFPIHDAIAPGFLDSFFRLPESDVQDPKALSVQKLLFSATLTRNPAKIASLQLSNPQYVAVQEGGDDGDDKQKYTTPAGLTVSFPSLTCPFSFWVNHRGEREQEGTEQLSTSPTSFYLGTYDRLRIVRETIDGTALAASLEGSLCIMLYKVSRICTSIVQVATVV
jgi:hypothetical protein